MEYAPQLSEIQENNYVLKSVHKYKHNILNIYTQNSYLVHYSLLARAIISGRLRPLTIHCPPSTTNMLPVM